MRIPVVHEETYKRQNVANKLKNQIQPCKALLLAGSVAYGGYYSVTPESDLELISIVDEQNCLESKFLGEVSARYLHSGKADLYKKRLPGFEFPVDIIFWRESFFEKVCKDINFKFGIRFSEENISQRGVKLRGFHENEISATYKCERTQGGFLTKYPTHLIRNDYYFAGVPVENLLSNPEVLAGNKEYVDKNIQSLWKILVKRISWENGFDEEPFLENLLLKKDRMPPSFLMSLIEKENKIRNFR